MYHDLLINLIASFIFLLLGLSYKRIKFFIITRNIRYLWNFSYKKEVNIVLSEKENPFKHSSSRVSFEEVKAYTKINDFFLKIGIKTNIILSTTQLDLITDKDLILLGGPLSNKIAEKLKIKYLNSSPYKFSKNKQIIKSVDTKYIPQKDANSGKWVKDYAIISRIKNPLNENFSIILSQGCHGFGTHAGINLLLDERKSKRINSMVNNKNSFSILIEVILEKNNITSINVVNIYEFN